MTKKSVALTRESLAQKNKHANRKEKFYLDEDEFEYIEYNPVFSKSKRISLLQELLHTVQEQSEKQNQEDSKKDTMFFTNEMEIIQYINFLILKYFTSIGDMLANVDFEGHISVMKELTDLEFIEVFINEVFDVDQVSKVYNEYYLVKERLNTYLMDLEKQMQITQNKTQQHISQQTFKSLATKAVGK